MWERGKGKFNMCIERCNDSFSRPQPLASTKEQGKPEEESVGLASDGNDLAQIHGGQDGTGKCREA